MAKTAIVYASKFGCTRGASDYIAERLGADVFNLGAQDRIDLSGYDRVLIGTGIYAGKPNKKVTEFVKNNKEQMEGITTGLFICCMYDGTKGEGQLKSVSEDYGIQDAVFFPGQSKRIKARDSELVDRYIETLEDESE